MTIEQLKQSIHHFYEKNQFDYEKRTDSFTQKLFNRPIENFEVIRNESNGKLFVMPAVNNLPLLFRGQSREFAPCLPTIYRGNPSYLDIFIERLRLIEFEYLLGSHPLVNYYTSNGFNLDVEGLAQHYGLKTEILDFSSDIEIALFFAMCPYDSKIDDYVLPNPPKREENMQGIIYVLNPMHYDNRSMRGNQFDIFMGDKVEPIGLQPFDRPAVQRGFGVRLSNGERLSQVRVFDFEYTMEQAEEYYNRFNKPSGLWVKDELIKPTKMIAKQKIFAYKVFKDAWRRYPIYGVTKSACLKQLNYLRGIEIDGKLPVSSFNSDDFDEQVIKDRWDKYRYRVQARPIYESIDNNGWTLKAPQMTTKEFAKIQLLRESLSGLIFPHGTRECKVIAQD